MPGITVTEVIAKKEKLCSDVCQLLQKFEEETGMKIASVYVAHAMSVGGEGVARVDLEVRV